MWISHPGMIIAGCEMSPGAARGLASWIRSLKFETYSNVEKKNTSNKYEFMEKWQYIYIYKSHWTYKYSYI